MKELLNGGGILAVIRLLTVVPCMVTWSIGGEYWVHDAKPWLSRNLLTLGHKLA